MTTLPGARRRARPPAVELQDVSLSYRMARHRGSSLKELAVNAWRRQVEYAQFTALRHVTAVVQPGTVLGVVGANGAGKSTLMKVVARVLPPSSGRVLVRGQVAPLIELGAGFNPELTGIENVVLYGALLGRPPQQMRSRATQILDWAGLREFCDVPLRAYSSGMTARLAFSVAVDAEPDVLLIDEVLSVGDAAFQRQSGERLSRLISGGAAGILVSHDVKQIRQHAHEVLWLDRGRVIRHGPAADVSREYEAASKAVAAGERIDL